MADASALFADLPKEGSPEAKRLDNWHSALKLFSDLPDEGQEAKGSFVPEFGKAVYGGLVGSAGTALKGAGAEQEVAKADRRDWMRNLQEQFSKIDAGTFQEGKISDPDVLDRVELYKSSSPEERAKLREAFKVAAEEQPPEMDVTKTPLYRAGKALQDHADSTARPAKDYENSITQQFGQGLGSLGVFMAASAINPVLGLQTGVSMSAGEGVDAAIRKGASKEQILQVANLGFAPGITEAAPLELLYNKIPLGKWGKLTDALIRIGAQFVAEGGQETLQQGMQNIIAKYAYNPDQDLTEGLLQSFLVGGAVGGAAATVAAPFHYGKGYEKIPEPKPAPAAEDAGTIIPPEEGGVETPPGYIRTSDLPPAPAPAPVQDRPDSPRLTPADRASPIPNSIIDDGKRAVEAATGQELKVTTAQEIGGHVQVTDTNVSDIVARDRAQTAALVDRITAGVSPAGIAPQTQQPAPPAIAEAVPGVGTPAETIAAPPAAPEPLLSPAVAEHHAAANAPSPDQLPSIPGAPMAKKGSTLADQITSLKARAAAYDADVAQLAESGTSIRMVSNRDPTKKVLIGPDMSAQDKGKFRVTYIDQHGPSGHTVHNTMEDAARQVIGSYHPIGQIAREAIKQDTAFTPGGRDIPVTYAIVEAGDLVTSQRDEGGTNPDYPQELQPRDRSRGTSDIQINSIAQNLNPALLDNNVSATDGAPIVSPEGIVESGNGRILGIRRAYGQGLQTAEGYKQYLIDQGYLDSVTAKSMKSPVLVRIRQAPMEMGERAAFAREANQRTTMEMSEPEQAMADANTLTPETLAHLRDGEIGAAANQNFVQAFARTVVSPNEQGAMVTTDGELSQKAVRRIRAALVAKAYGDANLVSTLFEDKDTNIAAIGGALMDAAGPWAKMRAETAAGTISPDADVTNYLLDAVRLIQRARNAGRPVAEFVAQTDVFSGKSVVPEAEMLMALMFRNTTSWTQPAGRAKIADALTFYAQEALKTHGGVDLLGEAAPASHKILAQAKARQYGQEETEATLAGRGRTAGKDTGAPAKERAVEAKPRPESKTGADVSREVPAEVTLPGGQTATIEHPDKETFNAVIDGKRVGQMNLTLKRAAPYATSVQVTGQRRLGIATALYDAAEKVLGRRLIPSPLGMSPEAIAFWKNRLSKMEPEEKQALLAEALKVGQDAGVGKSARERVDQLGYQEPVELSPAEAMKASIRADGEKRIAAAKAQTLAERQAKAQPKFSLGERVTKKPGKVGVLGGLKAEVERLKEEHLAALKERLNTPKIKAAIAKMAAIPPTDKEDGTGVYKEFGPYASLQWWASRIYNFGTPEEPVHVRGMEEAVPLLLQRARTLAIDELNEDRAKAGQPLLEQYTTETKRKATIIIGPPAAGKSTIANAIALRRKATIVDVDDAKKVIPEYYTLDEKTGKMKGGIGANAVHEESSALGTEVLRRAIANGDNLVLPKVGDKIDSMNRLRSDLQAQGYTVEMVLMDVSPQTALGRMLSRFNNTGRLINPDYFVGVAPKPAKTYVQAINEGKFDGYSRVVSKDDGLPARVSETSGKTSSLARGEGLKRDGTIEPGGRGEGPSAAQSAQEGQGQPKLKVGAPTTTAPSGARSETRQVRGGQIHYALGAAFAPKAEAFLKDFRKILDGYGLTGVSVKGWEMIFADLEHGAYGVEGQYLHKLIDVALTSKDPTMTLHHEAVHALFDLALSPSEKAILLRKSHKEWITDDIKKRYGEFSRAVQAEEGVAHAYTRWLAGERMDGMIARSFKRIKTYLKALLQALTKYDIRTADDVFRQMASGEIGRRTQGTSARSNPNIRFTFGGSRAATLDRAGLMRAQDMRDAGASRDEIYDATGFFVGHEGRWRFEINDDDAALDMSGAKQNPKDATARAKTGTLGSILKHPKLFAAYPSLADIPTTVVVQTGTGYSGDYQPDPKTESIEVVGRTEEEARSILLHEVMHALQTREDFAQGGNESMGEDYEGLEGDVAAAEAAIAPLTAEWEAKAAKGDYDSNLGRKINNMRESVARKARHQYYRRIAGEVEARNVQTRDAMRKKLKETGDESYQPDAPWWTQDTNADKVIFVHSKNDTAFKATSETVDMFEGKREQFVIPGAEKVSQATLAQRKADAPLRPTKGQKSVEALPLFSDSHNQLALFSKPPSGPNDPRFALASAPHNAQQSQQVMQGFLNRGQAVDRAIRLPFALLGGIDAKGMWRPGKRLTEKMGPAGVQGFGIGGVLGAGVGTFVGGPGLGTAAGFFAGGTVGAYILGSSPHPTNGRFGWFHGMAEHAKRGLIDGYGLDPEYIDTYRKSELGKAAILREAQGIMKVLSNAGVKTQEAKVLHAILNGDPVNDADMTRLAVPIRKAIDDMGAEAVSLGLISAESFQRNRGAYLHRVYLKNEIDQNTLAGWVSAKMGARRKKIIGDELKGRGMFMDVEGDRLMRDVESFNAGKRGAAVLGEKFHVIDEVSTTPSLTPGGPAKEKTLRRVYLPANEAVPTKYTGPNWVDRGTWEVRKAGNKPTLWRDYTKAERGKMGELVDARYTIAKTFMLMANDLSTGRFFKDVAQKAEWTKSTPPAAKWKEASEYSQHWNDPEIQWVKVPDTSIDQTGGKKRWGALSGKWVRAEIWRDLNEVDIANRPGTWRALLTQWKKNHTGRHPVVHMNNVMSNVAFMDMADVRTQDLVAGLKAFFKGDANYQEALDSGAFGGDMVSQEIRDQVLKPILEEITKSQTGAQNPFLARAGIAGIIADKLWTGIKTIDNGMLKAYQAEDQIFRMATYMRRRSQGESPQVAAQNARDQFLNYDIRAPWIRAMRNSLFPFISYTYRAVPKLAENISHRPWKLAKYMAIAYAVNALSYLWDDGDDGEDKERAALQKGEQGYTWLGSPRMIRMPWRDQNGLPVFLDVRRWIPAGDVFDTEQGSSALPIPAPLHFGGPLTQAFEFMLNKKSFDGKDITNDLTMDSGDKFTSVADWAWKSWTPPAFWNPNSYYWSRISDAIYGVKPSPDAPPYTIPQAVLSSLGIKLKPLDVENGISWNFFHFKQEQDALKKELRSNNYDLERGKISQKAFDSMSADVMEKFGNLEQRLKEFEKQIEPKKAAQ